MRLRSLPPQRSFGTYSCSAGEGRLGLAGGLGELGGRLDCEGLAVQMTRDVGRLRVYDELTAARVAGLWLCWAGGDWGGGPVG
jgi:hypothetical protein